MYRIARMTIILLLSTMLMPVLATEKMYGNLIGVCIGNYDGDTLTVTIPGVHPLLGDAIHVRVRHIDTPELHGTKGELHDKALAAKAFVSHTCSAGQAVELRNVGRDMYFRIDADVVCGGVDIAKELVNMGLAHDDYEGGTKEEWK